MNQKAKYLMGIKCICINGERVRIIGGGEWGWAKGRNFLRRKLFSLVKYEFLPERLKNLIFGSRMGAVRKKAKRIFMNSLRRSTSQN